MWLNISYHHSKLKHHITFASSVNLDKYLGQRYTEVDMSEKTFLNNFVDGEYQVVDGMLESTLIRNEKAFGNYTAKDVTDFIFLYLLSLKILKSEFDFAPVAAKYAKATVMYGHFKQLRRMGTDLYLLLFQLLNGNEGKYKKPDASRTHLEDVDAREVDIVRWLRMVAQNDTDINMDRRFLLKMENALNIRDSGYRAIRRLIIDWEDLNHSEKQLTMTRLLLALRTRAKKSELLPYLEQLAKAQKLELKGVNNPETNTGTTGASGSGNKLLKGAAVLGATYLGYKLGRKLMHMGESADVDGTEVDGAEAPVSDDPSIYASLPPRTDTAVPNNAEPNHEPSYTDDVLRKYNVRHDTVAPEKDASDDEDKIANRVLSKMSKYLRDKNAIFGPYSALINDIVAGVAAELDYDAVDIVRMFTKKFGHEPVMYFEINHREDETDTNEFEFATEDDVEGDLNVFDTPIATQPTKPSKPEAVSVSFKKWGDTMAAGGDVEGNEPEEALGDAYKSMVDEAKKKRTKGNYQSDDAGFDKAEKHIKYDPPGTANKGVSARAGFVGPSFQHQGNTIIENGTTAGCVATAATALGAGDPNASIYPPKKGKKKKPAKPVLIRR